ncbi:MAG: hypothetical protein LUG26_00580 [Ruminococcus sp.]|nr:hypothetical protein [Ruminococcus sp.]
MNIETVKSIFQLISGEEDTETHLPFIELAVLETEKMLTDGADTEDARLDFLCAAIANFRLQQANSARDRSESVYAGRLISSSDSGSTLEFSEKLLLDYMNLCEDLIDSRTFVFMRFGPDGRLIENA